DGETCRFFAVDVFSGMYQIEQVGERCIAIGNRIEFGQQFRRFGRKKMIANSKGALLTIAQFGQYARAPIMEIEHSVEQGRRSTPQLAYIGAVFLDLFD